MKESFILQSTIKKKNGKEKTKSSGAKKIDWNSLSCLT